MEAPWVVFENSLAISDSDSSHSTTEGTQWIESFKLDHNYCSPVKLEACDVESPDTTTESPDMTTISRACAESDVQSSLPASEEDNVDVNVTGSQNTVSHTSLSNLEDTSQTSPNAISYTSAESAISCSAVPSVSRLSEEDDKDVSTIGSKDTVPGTSLSNPEETLQSVKTKILHASAEPAVSHFSVQSSLLGVSEENDVDLHSTGSVSSISMCDPEKLQTFQNEICLAGVESAVSCSAVQRSLPDIPEDDADVNSTGAENTTSNPEETSQTLPNKISQASSASASSRSAVQSSLPGVSKENDKEIKIPGVENIVPTISSYPEEISQTLQIKILRASSASASLCPAFPSSLPAVSEENNAEINTPGVQSTVPTISLSYPEEFSRTWQNNVSHASPAPPLSCPAIPSSLPGVSEESDTDTSTAGVKIMVPTVSLSNPLETSQTLQTPVKRVLGSVSKILSLSPSKGSAELQLDGWLHVVLQSDSDKVDSNVQFDNQFDYGDTSEDLVSDSFDRPESHESNKYDRPANHESDKLDLLEDLGHSDQEGDETEQNDEPSCTDQAPVSSVYDKEPPYECAECNRIFSNYSSMQSHMTAMHPMFECKQCRKRFNKETLLKTHMSVHDKEKLQKCADTQKLATPTGDVSDDTPAVKRVFQCLKCSLCGKVFANRTYLQSHEQRVHKFETPAGTSKRGTKKLWKCALCAKYFATFSFLYKHQQTVHMDSANSENTNETAASERAELPVSQLTSVTPDLQDVEDDEATFEPPAKEEMPSQQERSESCLCPKCGRYFGKEAELRTHLLMHKVKKRFKCDFCEECFWNNRELRKHLRLQHPVERNKCPHCGKVFRQRCELTKHLPKHSTEPQFQCHYCGKAYRQKSSLNEHLQLHRDPKPFKCRQCGLEFDSRFRQRKHLETHREPKEHLCPICGRTFTSKMAHTQHVNRHSYSEKQREKMARCEKTHHCGQCEKSFKTKQELKVHRMRHTGNLPYVCSVCGKGFCSAAACKKHLFVHSDEKTFLCAICGAKFKHKASLNYHLQTHRGDNAFKCVQCGEAFKSKHVLIKHRRARHGLKSHTCDQCGRQFYYPKALEIHLRFHAGERPYVCKICGKAYSQAVGLRNHTRLHTGERPYACTICEKTFTTKTSLTQHEYSHSTVKMFKCPICHKAFKYRSHMDNHRKTHERTAPHVCQVCNKEFAVKAYLSRHLKTVHQYAEPQELFTFDFSTATTVLEVNNWETV